MPTSLDLMKSAYKKISLFVTAILICFNVSAQTTDSSYNYVQPFSKGSAFRTWSVGLNGGVLAPFNEDYTNAGYQPGYGGYIKDQILSTFGIQAGFLAGRAQGNNAANGQFSKYVTTLDYAVDLSVNITLANINWRHKKGVIQPYFTGGYGYMGYEPELTTAGPVAGRVTFPFKNNGGNVQSFYVPVGTGIKFTLSHDISLDLGFQVDLVASDNFDGLNYGTRNDEFYYAHIGLEIALGNSKKPQLATHNPVASMRTEYLMVEKALQLQIDAQKAQIDKLKSDLAAKIELINSANANLTNFAKLTTDSDGDGVPDLFDKCPNTPAGTIIDGSGCPLILPAKQPDVKVYVTEEDKKVVKEAVDNLQFDFGKATIRAVSFETLERLAKLLKEKNLSLKLAGYTDNVGPDAVNVRISTQRAEAIKSYLVAKGVSPLKIEAIGYGKENPIASNNTGEGRQLNRRVEFNVY